MTDKYHKTWNAETACVHAGYERGTAEQGLNTPIVTSTAFDYSRDDQVRYPRYMNTPNHRVVANRIAALEGAEATQRRQKGITALMSLDGAVRNCSV